MEVLKVCHQPVVVLGKKKKKKLLWSVQRQATLITWESLAYKLIVALHVSKGVKYKNVWSNICSFFSTLNPPMGVDTPFVGVCGLCLDSSVCVCGSLKKWSQLLNKKELCWGTVRSCTVQLWGQREQGNNNKKRGATQKERQSLDCVKLLWTSSCKIDDASN